MKHFRANRYRLIFLMVFFIIVTVFAWTFAFSPFSESVNSLILNGGTTLSAMIAAIIFTVIPFYYQPGEPPRKIWIAFATYAWLWTIAEAIWGYLYIRDGEVPGYTIADIFWLVGYVALTFSLAYQFKLISFSQTKTVTWAAIWVWVGVLAVTAMIPLSNHSDTPLEDFFSYYYLLADTAVGLLALYLVYAFRARALSIPWLAISSFVVSDFIYVHLTESGVYDYVMSGISVALLADTLYVIAYLLIAWGGLEQYLLLRSNAHQSQAEN